MKDCTDPAGHQWANVTLGSYWSWPNSASGGVPVRSRFHGVESTMVKCELCGEIGYRLVEVAS